MSLLFGLSRQNSAIVSTKSSDSGFYSLIKNALRVMTRNGRKVRLAISASTTGQLILITDLTETRLLQARRSEEHTSELQSR